MIKTLKSLFAEPCTMWFNRWGRHDWSHCCKDHDDGYGKFKLPYDRYAYRFMKDEELRDCVNKVAPGMGSLMFAFVRAFGWFFMRGRDGN